MNELIKESKYNYSILNEVKELINLKDNKEYITLKLTNEELYSGSLILVNKDNKFRQRIVNILPLDNDYFEIYRKRPMYINELMVKPLLNLIDDIDGKKKLVAVSGYRSEEEQRRIYKESILENGLEFTKKYVAKPRQSEHQTGLAIDLGEVVENIDFICPSFPNHGICKEFKELAQDYGFIMRYKKDKEKITNISEEVWHFRYVGSPHARIMNEKNFCLEEYIDYLKNFKYKRNSLKLIDNGYKVEIFYVEKLDKITEVKFMKNKRYDVSGNNVDGFIVTLFEELKDQ